MGVDLAPLWLSLRVAFVATVTASLVGIPLAWLLARRQFFGRDLLAVLVVLPMVLPPTVLGYYLLVGVGRRSPIGRWIENTSGESIVFTAQGAALAATIAALPFLVRAAQGGFEGVESTYEEAARTLGRSEWSIFLTVTVPLAWRGILAGLALCFARAMGDFGTTLLVAGNIPGRTQTASIAIYDAVQAGRLEQANTLAALLAVLTGGLLFLLTRLGRLGRW